MKSLFIFTTIWLTRPDVEAFTPHSISTTFPRRQQALYSIVEPPTKPTSSTSTIKPVVRTPETPERVRIVRERFRRASQDAAEAKGCAQTQQGDEWWRNPVPVSDNGRDVTKDEPLRVIIAGGGVAGLVTAAACHAKGMKVTIFEQASQYAPYGGPIQIQSNALRALERINPKLYEEIIKAGTVTADSTRVRCP